jgi:trehalose 6-phosphate synthase
LSRLVVVSNRVALPSQVKSGGAGGLAVAVMAALRQRGGIWFGWSGEVSEAADGTPKTLENGKVTFATMDLKPLDHEEYYNGFANRVLWPLFHYRPGLTDFNRRYRLGYNRVNELFAGSLGKLLRDDDVLWVHDYHLIPLGANLRRRGHRQRLGFFLHIPWPALEVFLVLPNHRELVEAMCAYDLIGFQTARDLRAFRDYIELEAGGRSNPDGTFEAFGRRVRAAVFPISIDTQNIARMAVEAEAVRQVQRLRASLQRRAVMIGVDRLDYSKGLVPRMHAYAQLLEAHPENRGRVVLLQIAPQTREGVPEYDEIRRDLETISGHLNGTYAEFDWAPLRYLNKGFSRRTLAGFFRASRVGLVTPLRDGMNLVAKEYVAAQMPDDPGALVLSRFAGAADELDGALIVNPHDIEDVAEAMQKALHLPLDERQDRWRRMYDRLYRYDIDFWRDSFLTALSGAQPVER